MMVTGALSSPKARSGMRFRLHQVGHRDIFRVRNPAERGQRGGAEHAEAKRDGGGALAKLAAGDLQLKLRGLVTKDPDRETVRAPSCR